MQTETQTFPHIFLALLLRNEHPSTAESFACSVKYGAGKHPESNHRADGIMWTCPRKRLKTPFLYFYWTKVWAKKSQPSGNHTKSSTRKHGDHLEIPWRCSSADLSTWWWSCRKPHIITYCQGKMFLKCTSSSHWAICAFLPKSSPKQINWDKLIILSMKN